MNSPNLDESGRIHKGYFHVTCFVNWADGLISISCLPFTSRRIQSKVPLDHKDLIVIDMKKPNYYCLDNLYQNEHRCNFKKSYVK